MTRAGLFSAISVLLVKGLQYYHKQRRSENNETEYIRGILIIVYIHTYRLTTETEREECERLNPNQEGSMQRRLVPHAVGIVLY